MDVLFLSPADWFGPRGRFQNLAEKLSANNRVMYTDGLGVRPIGPRDWRRVLRKLWLTVRPPMRPGAAPPGLSVITPLVVPWRSRASVRRLNPWLLRRYIQGHLRAEGFANPLVWISYPHPDLVSVAREFGGGTLVYDCVDDWPAFGKGYQDIRDAEADLLTEADIVFTTATPLFERAASLNPHSYLVPNGVDVEEYAQALLPGIAAPTDMTMIDRPRIGFIGNVAEWVDLDIVTGICDERPDWNVIMIGHYQHTQRRPKRDNLHWLGFCARESIPHYLSTFDACIIPFVTSELTRSIDPLKLYEYLAAGRPVVTTPLPSAADFGDLVYVVEGVGEFVRALEEALAESRDRFRERVEAVLPYSWDARFATIATILRERHDVPVAPAPDVA